MGDAYYKDIIQDLRKKLRDSSMWPGVEALINRIRALEAEIAETEKGLEIQALISYNAVARAEKAEVELAHILEHSDDGVHRALDGAGVAKSNIQPDGPLMDGVIVRLGFLVKERDALKAEVKRLKAGLCTVRKRFNLEHDSDCYG